MKQSPKIIAFALAVLILSAGFYFYGFENSGRVKAQQASGNVLTGCAWSSNIGWISFNCEDACGKGNVCASSNYQVQTNPSTGLLSGYAWSSNIGWIYFGPDSGAFKASDAPQAPKKWAATDSSGQITGWARALSYGGGWDGWIKMYNNPSDSNNAANKTRLEGNFIKGFAWAGDVVGWIKFCKDAADAGVNYCVTKEISSAPLEPLPAPIKGPGRRIEVPAR